MSRAHTLPLWAPHGLRIFGGHRDQDLNPLSTYLSSEFPFFLSGFQPCCSPVRRVCVWNWSYGNIILAILFIYETWNSFEKLGGKKSKVYEGNR